MAWRAGGADAPAETSWTSGLAPAGSSVTSPISCPVTSGPPAELAGGGLMGETRRGGRWAPEREVVVWVEVDAVGGRVEVVDVELGVAEAWVVEVPWFAVEVVDWDAWFPAELPGCLPLLFRGPVGVCDFREVPEPLCLWLPVADGPGAPTVIGSSAPPPPPAVSVTCTLTS